MGSKKLMRMFEHKAESVISRKRFLLRLLRSLRFTVLAVSVSLLLGVVGYHYFEQLPWLDCLLNASMILGGMGEVDPLKTDGGKIFASLYALYSGLVFIAVTGILLAPVLHRIMHTFHSDKE
jgi:hypothetical protein